jgi:hypothetical protein
MTMQELNMSYFLQAIEYDMNIMQSLNVWTCIDFHN